MDTEKQNASLDLTLGGEKRIIKRYSNRKLYDTKDSRYVTLQQIGEMVRRGEDVQIIDNKTKEDKTEVTLALIISEDLKNRPQSVPLGMLRTLIQKRGDRFLSQLRDGPIGRMIPGGEEGEGEAEQPAPSAPAPEPAESAPTEVTDSSEAEAEEKTSGSAMARLHEMFESYRHALDQLQANVDERMQELVPGIGLIRELRTDVDQLTQRVDELTARLARLDGNSGVDAPHQGSEQTSEAAEPVDSAD